MDIEKEMEKLDIENVNIEKTRRTTRDLLNKTQKKDDILKCALILGARITTKTSDLSQNK